MGAFSQLFLKINEKGKVLLLGDNETHFPHLQHQRVYQRNEEREIVKEEVLGERETSC